MPNESSDLPGESAFGPELRALLDCERGDPYAEADAARKATLLRRLEHRALARAASSASEALGGSGAAGTSLAKPLVMRLAKIGTASLLVAVGALTGALLESQRQAVVPARQTFMPVVDPVTPVAPVTHASPALEPKTAVIPSVDVDSLPRVAPKPPVLVPTVVAPGAPATASAHPTDTSLGEEQRLLDIARAAVARGAYDAALSPLHDHEERFPRGRLAEERELLFVQALSGAGQDREAKARAKAFETQFPRSIFLPTVKATSSSHDP